jgi:hypothetical protein
MFPTSNLKKIQLLAFNFGLMTGKKWMGRRGANLLDGFGSKYKICFT